MNFSFELLANHHQDSLLAFELANRRGFERLIASRGNDFYSPEAVRAHIARQSELYRNAKAHSLVLIKGQQILARANLKNINNQQAEVGYRVAQACAGQGVAQACLRELMTVAARDYGLRRLVARVLDNNPASMHILKKHGFEVIEEAACSVDFNGQAMRCHRLDCFLAPPP